MSEKEMKDQSVDGDGDKEAVPVPKTGESSSKKKREDRLAEALRANLRRRKSAAKSRQDD